ncbi:hypothetical protein HPB51_015919 [Rhipicephalus microplus]|uniref:CCDC174 alpha/beta GRSR domain-containing protein n=1 Tax=Rhipicephalus microplus TaxID=6941 RepID=A0A9J6DHT9_RHIMP|nr:coiled-coil domain-containing protein 174-like [Rhipicephalus microplus]KAH8021523.1 hypothetical protein HPB51_015919 [Rhipicephalus microplus]
MEGSNKKGTFGKVSLGASVSSLIDLKAELLRKREAVKVQKLKQFHPEDGYVKQKLILGSYSGAATKKEPPKKAPAAPDIAEEDADLKRSRAALQRKAKLYEKLSSGKVIPGDEEASQYVVNFQRKAMDAAVEERERREMPTVPTREEAAAVCSKDDLDADDNAPSADHEALDKSLAGTEEEWVDYTDALGRSRRCMRKDLPALIDSDKELTGKAGVVEADIPERTAQFLAHERTREQLRQQWQDQEAENAYKESLHYGDVRFQEAREHGVGFYDLSGDSVERQKQLELLNKLREQTERQKEISKKMKQKRKAMLEARLARIRQKKNIPDNKQEEENKDSSEDETEQVDANSSVPDRPKIAGDSNTLEVPEMRPWDEGKNLADMVNDPLFRKKKLSQDDWVELQRQERPTEFAPPSAYRPAPGPKRPKYSNFTKGQTQFGANVDTSDFQETEQASQPRHLQSSAFEDMIAQRLAEARRASEQQSPWGGPF